jgi:GrpB-like predicted nucleotidyltransferase (UPF0157 family)/GNAT superfamily N-acetyltransferase
MNRKVEVVPYDPNWPAMFEKEAKLIRQALGDNCIAIHHIGSTSVPGLSAKPVIDILPVVKDILAVDQRTSYMESLGYEAKGENGMAFRRFFQKGTSERTHHVHVYEEGDPEVDRYLKFRNWLRSHPEDAKAYASLKASLAQKFPQDILKYCFGKDEFVASIDAKDGFNGWRVVRALTDREWAAVHRLRERYYLILKKPPPCVHKDHIHFVFYKNSEIIGYIDLDLLPNNQAELKLLIIDELYQHLGFGSQFLTLCERWLRQKGGKKVFVQAPDSAHSFYLKRGYRQKKSGEMEKILNYTPID